MEMTRSGLSTSFTSLTISVISPSFSPSLPPPSLLLGTYGSQGRRLEHARRSLRRCLGRYHYYLGGFVKGEEEEAFARGAAVAGGGEEGRREGGREGGREEGYVEC